MANDVVDKVTSDLIRQASDSQVPIPDKKIPEGHVERTLNFRDRNLLVGACREFCREKGKGDHKAQSKLDRVTKIVSFEETLDYFNMIDDAHEDAVFRWQRLRNDYLVWRQYEGGALDLKTLRERAPGVDPENPPQNPGRKQPEQSSEESRGRARAFHFPSKLDVWIQDALKVYDWQPEAAEYAVELCAKFGLKSDED